MSNKKWVYISSTQSSQFFVQLLTSCLDCTAVGVGVAVDPPPNNHANKPTELTVGVGDTTGEAGTGMGVDADFVLGIGVGEADEPPKRLDHQLPEEGDGEGVVMLLGLSTLMD
jgi:hypothetical protein